jgi:hypothetical protein
MITFEKHILFACTTGVLAGIFSFFLLTLQGYLNKEHLDGLWFVVVSFVSFCCLLFASLSSLVISIINKVTIQSLSKRDFSSSANLSALLISIVFNSGNFWRPDSDSIYAVMLLLTSSTICWLVLLSAGCLGRNYHK